jgi:hypothetical protein
MPPDQRTRVQEEMADRERQASALAAAGMVAESVDYTKPGGGVHQIAMEGMNWNDLAGNMDDIDMEFATMFDPEQERMFMQDPMSFHHLPVPPQDSSSSSTMAPSSSTGMTTMMRTTTTTTTTEEHGIPNPLNASL